LNYFLFDNLSYFREFYIPFYNTPSEKSGKFIFGNKSEVIPLKI